VIGPEACWVMSRPPRRVRHPRRLDPASSHRRPSPS
jgi:hypothetical protein